MNLKKNQRDRLTFYLKSNEQFNTTNEKWNSLNFELKQRILDFAKADKCDFRQNSSDKYTKLREICDYELEKVVKSIPEIRIIGGYVLQGLV